MAEAQGGHGLLGLPCLSFWPFGLSFPFILAFWAFISFHFGLLGFHFLSFWPFRPSFPFILAFWALFPFILAFWAFISFLHPSGCPWGPPHKLPKTVRFAFVPYKEFSRARPGFIFRILAFWASILHFGLLGLDFLSFWPFGPLFSFILAFWAFISFHFGFLGLYFLSFWFFGLSYPFILAFWAFISFHFGILGLHFLSFWPFRSSFPFILVFWALFPFILAFWAFISFLPSSGCPWGPPHKLPKTERLVLPLSHIKNLAGPGPASFSKFWPFGLQFLILAFWALISFILAFWAFISFHFGLLGFHFLSFWPFGPLFPFILALWALGHSILTGATSTKPPTGRPGPNLWATKLDENRLLRQPRRQNRPRADQSPNPWATKLGKNRLLRQPRRQNRQRADQSPNPWATKLGKTPVKAAMSTKPPTGRPKSKPELAVDLL